MTRDWRTLLAQAAAQEAENNRRNRDLVLRYPDIAVKLTAPPLRLSRPENWNGSLPGPYLPEEEDPDGRHGPGRVRPNRSPVRAQLLAILHEAAERADAETKARPATTNPESEPSHA